VQWAVLDWDISGGSDRERAMAIEKGIATEIEICKRKIEFKRQAKARKTT